MDPSMLMRDSKRLCAPSQEADAQKPCTTVENPDMDGSLWSRLPEDLVDRVLAWLPAASLLRLRTVCRRWSEIMATKCFLEVCTQVNRLCVTFHWMNASSRIISCKANSLLDVDEELMSIPGGISPALLCQDLRL
jgi:hypothetical protein